jgi:hypothetical protein
MILAILIFLILLWVLGYVDSPAISLHNIALYDLLGKTITLYDVLIFAVMAWLINLLPWPFRGLASVILVLWLLAFFGIIAIAGFSQIIILALIVGLVVYLFTGGRKLF